MKSKSSTQQHINTELEDEWYGPHPLSRTIVYPLTNIQRYWLNDDQVTWKVCLDLEGNSVLC